jgi:hypothetical protein
MMFRAEIRNYLWSENLKGRGQTAETGVDGKISVGMLYKQGVNVWTECC